MRCLALVTTLLLWTARALAAEPCDRIVSYFLSPYQDSQLKGNEWRIFDPSRQTDVLFLSIPGGVESGGFGGVRWDTTFDHAWFSHGDSLYRVPWRLGAKPRAISSLPRGSNQWWFDPDSGCWQALRITDHPWMNEPAFETYAAELLQSSRDGTAWRVIRADTVAVADLDNDRWEWLDQTPVEHEARTTTLNDLASEAWQGAWGETLPFDTATVAIRKGEGTGYPSEDWFLLPMRAAPHRGLAFRYSEPGAPEYNWSGADGPFYFVDLDRGTKQLIEGTGEGEGSLRALASEHCGFLLIPGLMGNPRVIDSSGRRVFSGPRDSEHAVWVPRPRR